MDEELHEIFEDMKDLVAVHRDIAKTFGQQVAEANNIPEQIKADLQAVSLTIRALESATAKAESVGQGITRQMTSERRITRETAKVWVGLSLFAALVFLCAGGVAGWKYAQVGVQEAAEQYHIAISKLPDAAKWAATNDGKLAAKVWPKTIGKIGFSQWSDSELIDYLEWVFSQEAMQAYVKRKK